MINLKTGIFKSMAAIAVAGVLVTGVATASDKHERGQHGGFHKNGAHKMSEIDRDVMRHEWFASVDLNNDGFISEEEFVAAAVKRAEAGARAVFTRMDSDNTGEISAEQFNALAEQRAERFAERRDAMRDRAKERRRDRGPRTQQ